MEVETVTLWFADGAVWTRVIEYAARILQGHKEETESHAVSHVWQCIEQCLFYDAGKLRMLITYYKYIY